MSKIDIKFVNDELFIFVGLATMNMKDPSVILNACKGYIKNSKAHKLQLTSEQLDKFIDEVVKKHSSPDGVTLKLIKKLQMYKEINLIQMNYDKKINDIKNKYKSQIINIESV